MRGMLLVFVTLGWAACSSGEGVQDLSQADSIASDGLVEDCGEQDFQSSPDADAMPDVKAYCDWFYKDGQDGSSCSASEEGLDCHYHSCPGQPDCWVECDCKDGVWHCKFWCYECGDSDAGGDHGSTEDAFDAEAATDEAPEVTDLPECPPETPHKLTDGTCVECLNSADCAQPLLCDQATHTCNEPPCDAGYKCDDGQCHRCCEDEHCIVFPGTAALCTDYNCSPGGTDNCGSSCAPPYPVCANVGGEWQCVQCDSDDDCPEGQKCTTAFYCCD